MPVHGWVSSWASWSLVVIVLISVHSPSFCSRISCRQNKFVKYAFVGGRYPFHSNGFPTRLHEVGFSGSISSLLWFQAKVIHIDSLGFPLLLGLWQILQMSPTLCLPTPILVSCRFPLQFQSISQYATLFSEDLVFKMLIPKIVSLLLDQSLCCVYTSRKVEYSVVYIFGT